MKYRISAKIFIILMVGFMLILGISAKLNIKAQKNLYLSWIREQYNYGRIHKVLLIYWMNMKFCL